jgi:hypothetical protein
MPTLDDHEERLQQHAERIRLLEDLMARAIALNELVVQLLQRQADGGPQNGQP